MRSGWGGGDSGGAGLLWSPAELPSTEGACRNGSTANSPGAVSGIAMSAMQPMATRQPSVMRSQGFLSDDRPVAMPSSIHEQWMSSLVSVGADAACAARCTKRANQTNKRKTIGKATGREREREKV